MKIAALLAIGLLSFSAFAKDPSEIFVIRKNHNAKNTLHYKASVENCKFKSNSVTPTWFMGEERGQIEGITSAEVRYFKPQFTYEKDTEVDFSFGAMDKLGAKVELSSIKVRLVNCQPKAYIEIDGREINLQEIRVQLNFLKLPKSMTILGLAADGSPFSYDVD